MLIFTTTRNVSYLVIDGRKIPAYKSQGTDENGKTVYGAVANVPVETRKFLVGHPHWQDYDGQVALPSELNDYAEGKVGDPTLADFPLATEPVSAGKAKTSKTATPAQ